MSSNYRKLIDQKRKKNSKNKAYLNDKNQASDDERLKSAK